MDGQISVLLQPRKMVVILGAEINAIIYGNPKSALSSAGKAARWATEKAATA